MTSAFLDRRRPYEEVQRAARVKREQESFDDGLQRARYDDALSHCQAYWHDAVLRLCRKTILADGARDVLEIGSHGWAMLFDAATPTPKNLHCINISQRELENGREKATSRNVNITFRQMDAHALDYEDNSFDVVFGFGILHHLDYEAALDEIHRVLRPGGKMIFNEPLDMNPVGRLVRRLTPEARTIDEAPLRGKHLRLFHERFDVSYYPQQFLSVPAGLLSRLLAKSPRNPFMRAAFAADQVLAKAPGLRFWFRKTVIIGVKDG